MSKLDEAIAKMPRSLLVFLVLAGALAFIVSQNPLSDGCEVEITNFAREARGIITAYKTKKGRQFATLFYALEQCKEGNNQGSCEDYFKALKRVADATRVVSPKCYPKLKLEYENLTQVLATGVKVMALVAWGDKPPEGIGQRLGTLTEGDVYGFCRSKNGLVQLTSLEEYKSFRASVYREFPDRWPENLPLEKRAEIPRPRALQSVSNPTGTLKESDVYERSLFSLRCDLYQ
ncbi:hypothetical protein [Pseudobdellovibrio sp. HCB154]|uniref:hypothetical protein n=1 Tax=Pseudobdellovibrio sp. HCB154 TaxID=3386277 RepID=UPI0039171D9D